MTFSYTPGAGDRDMVRLLIRDTRQDRVIFADEEIDAFLALEGDLRLATAAACETIAFDQALLYKVARALDLQVDGAKLAQALLERAARLRTDAQALVASEQAGAFAIAEMVVDWPSYVDRRRAEYLRTGP